MANSQIIINKIRERLFSLQDMEYKEFHRKLIPNIESDRIIGVRTPQLRALAKELFSTQSREELPLALGRKESSPSSFGRKELQLFLSELPHYYYEENNLHAFLIAQIKDFDECVSALNAFLPYIDNWATCDGLRPVVFKKQTQKLISEIRRWLAAEEPYVVRFGIEMLMVHFLEDEFAPEHLDWVAAIQSGEYYVNMMIAWYFATALAKQYDATVTYIKNYRLPPWVHNKTIQKAIESFRITDEHKLFLRTLRLKSFN